jgi:hypothetical protein
MKVQPIEKPDIAADRKSIRRFDHELLGPHGVRGDHDAFAVPKPGPRSPNRSQISANCPRIFFILQLHIDMAGRRFDLPHGDEKVKGLVVDRKGDIDARVR